MLTAGQSAGCIKLYSLGKGGRQQPGHPGLFRPALFAGGSVRAHYEEIIRFDAIEERSRCTLQNPQLLKVCTVGTIS